jgi:uncharacterized protein YdeI (YjbR/CyaY-like superfamily)
MNPHVDIYLTKVKHWREELQALRTIILDCGLDEDLKWGSPCYSFKQSNVAIIGGLKDHCVLSFFKGALLNDSSSLLEEPGPNTQAARTIRFRDIKEIEKLATILEAYLFEAIEVEKAGLKVDFPAKTALKLPEELIQAFNENPTLKTAFEQLTPGRQRAYHLFFSAPKQSKTIIARIDKVIPQILQGKGLTD